MFISFNCNTSNLYLSFLKAYCIRLYGSDKTNNLIINYSYKSFVVIIVFYSVIMRSDVLSSRPFIANFIIPQRQNRRVVFFFNFTDKYSLEISTP